jgi:hypothetical protein
VDAVQFAGHGHPDSPGRGCPPIGTLNLQNIDIGASRVGPGNAPQRIARNMPAFWLVGENAPQMYERRIGFCESPDVVGGKDGAILAMMTRPEGGTGE